MQNTFKINHTSAKNELERLLHDNIELQKFHERVTETIDAAFDDEDEDLTPVLIALVYPMIESKENSIDRYSKILIILEGMEEASKKHKELNELYIYNLMKVLGSLDKGIFKYLDEMYDLKKMEDEEVEESEDEGVL